MMKYSLMLITCLLLVTALNCQVTGHTIKKTEGVPSPPATLDQFSFIVGHWKGEAFGGVTEEIWTPPSNGSMMGSFKLSHGDEVAFYELCVIRPLGESVIFQLKHFHGDLKGWEEKDETVDFPLVKITEDKAYFDQCTFEKINDDEMHVYVVIEQKDAPPEEVKFVYHRVKN